MTYLGNLIFTNLGSAGSEIFDSQRGTLPPGDLGRVPLNYQASIWALWASDVQE